MTNEQTNQVIEAARKMPRCLAKLLTSLSPGEAVEV
jgi:hypothetical protein